jgi:hypothetical protein
MTSPESGFHVSAFTDELFFHATKDAIVIFVTAAPGALIIFLIIHDAFLAFLHLHVSIAMDFITSITLSLARVLVWSQS